MLAVSATGTLSLLDASELKRAPSLASACLSLTQPASSSSWSFDNTALFLASSQTVHRYDPISNVLKDIHHLTSAESISHILCKDKATLIYSVGDKVHLLECGSTVKVTQTIESHRSSITSLSLSNDCTLLATTSSNTVHVHNLTLGSHTTLRGIASGGSKITTSAFHPHGRTRLLVGIGKQLLVYDIARPSAPLKTITLNEATSGDIVAIACSPFSKTLVAVASSGGHVGLIDLEKEKGLFRTLNVKVPLTTLTFSAEGATLYLGTEHGKLLILDLRALDKAPKIITISEIGSRIETMSVQRKIKSGEASAKPTPVAAPQSSDTARKVSAQTASKPPTKEGTTPTRARVTRVSYVASPARRLPSVTSLKETGGVKKTTPRKSLAEKKIFSPVRDPHGNSIGDISIQIETLKGVDSKSTQVKAEKKSTASPLRSHLAVSPKLSSISAISSRTTSQDDKPPRARTVPAAIRTQRRSSHNIDSTESGVRPSTRTTDGEHISSRQRAGSSASRPGSVLASATPASVVSASTRPARPGSSASRPESRLRHASPAPPAPRLPRDVPLPESRTPSPELPDINHDPMTPVPAMKRAKSRTGMEMLGLGTPELDRWIRAGKGQGTRGVDRKGKGKTVGFEDSSDEEDSDGEERERERERSLSMQVSPRRPSTSWQPSPVHHSPAHLNNSGSSAHDLLRTIIKDVMYDFQRETRAEMTGLHLDLVRMGRGWKKELRELMQEYAGGLEELREENRRLREENERLRRGY
ncbi:hypothetical protein H0H92_002984 [Tricholoma furcatifolium]|nr:hypothetical protein H0H92_002984 [Tricholoma furcatifolium]